MPTTKSYTLAKGRLYFWLKDFQEATQGEKTISYKM